MSSNNSTGLLVEGKNFQHIKEAETFEILSRRIKVKVLNKEDTTEERTAFFKWINQLYYIQKSLKYYHELSDNEEQKKIFRWLDGKSLKNQTNNADSSELIGFIKEVVEELHRFYLDFHKNNNEINDPEKGQEVIKNIESSKSDEDSTINFLNYLITPTDTKEKEINSKMECFRKKFFNKYLEFHGNDPKGIFLSKLCKINEKAIELNEKAGDEGKKELQAIQDKLKEISQILQSLNDSVGLALSGGGIRSAIFNLGLLTGLNNYSHFGKIDYLSTVSGGGYIGSALTFAMQRDQGKFPFEFESKVTQHIRKNASYMMMGEGIDWWSLVGAIFRGVLINLLIIVPAVLFITYLLQTEIEPLNALFQNSLEIKDQTIFLSRLFTSVCVFTGYFITEIIIRSMLVRWSQAQAFKIDASLLPTSVVEIPCLNINISTTPLTILVSIFLLSLSWSFNDYWIDGLIPSFFIWILIKLIFFERFERIKYRGRLFWDLLLFVIFAVCFNFLFSRSIFEGLGIGPYWISILTGLIVSGILLGLKNSDDVKDVQKQKYWNYSYLIFETLLWAITIPITDYFIDTTLEVFYPNQYPSGFKGQYSTVMFAIFWVGIPILVNFVLANIAYALLSRTRFRLTFIGHKFFTVQYRDYLKSSVILIFVGLTPLIYRFIFIFSNSLSEDRLEGIFSFIATSGLLTILSGTVAKGRYRLIGLALLRLGLGLLVLGSVLLSFSLVVNSPFNRITLPITSNLDFSEISQLNWIVIVGVVVWLLLVISTDINYVSMFRYYRNRLVDAMFFSETFEQSDKEPQLNRQLNLSQINILDSGAPYPILNTIMITRGSKNKKLSNRLGDNFIFTPRHVGSQATGWAPTKEGYFYENQNLGTSMAISGAALDPNLSYSSNWSVRFIMGLLNIRLGYWIRNPTKCEPTFLEKVENIIFSKSTHSKHWLNLAIREMSGLPNETWKFVRLSDGGLFENLGIYELVRRQCSVIIASDAGENFENLRHAIRLVRVDFNADIIINLDDLMANEKTKLSKKPFVAGYIKYKNERGETTKIGLFIYIKSTVFKDVREDVLGYWRKNPIFPNESTLDQFFEEDQFEAYRILGYHTAEAMNKIFDLMEYELTSEDIAQLTHFRHINEVNIFLRERLNEEEKSQLLKTVSSYVIPLDKLNALLWKEYGRREFNP